MKDFFVINFPLFCICIAMGFMAINNYRNNKKMSIDIILILSLAIILSGVVAIEAYAKTDVNLIDLATVMTYIGYSLRPVCMYLFVRIADEDKIIPNWVFILTIVINAVMYSPSLFYETSGRYFAYYYTYNDTNTALVFNRGYVNFTSHIISALYLLYVIYLSYRLISSNHKVDGVVILTCALFVIIAVILESLELATNLLNVTIAISCVFYYLFINRDRNRKDALTGLLNRKTYYEDLERFGKKVVGLIQIDMNGLKHINDTKGHEEGDKAIRSIAQAILSSIKKDMSAYRMGGDEFLILSTSSSEENFLLVQKHIREQVEKAGYYCSIGFAYKSNNEDVDALFKKSEEWMYVDKSNFYKTHKIERRR